MPRRTLARNRKPLTESQIQEIRRKERNFNNRRRYALKQKEAFLKEYEAICKKYGCAMMSFYGVYLTKQKRGEEIRTIKQHLISIRRQLNKEY